MTLEQIAPIPKALIIVLASVDFWGMGQLVQVENVFYCTKTLSYSRIFSKYYHTVYLTFSYFEQTLTNVLLNQITSVAQKLIAPIPQALIIVLVSMDIRGMGRIVQVGNNYLLVY